MGLFGFGKKEGRLSEDEKAMRELRSHPTLGPITQFAEALNDKDEGELRAAMSREMTCGKCGHEFVMAQGFQKSDTVEGFTDVKCPKCGQLQFNFGVAKK